MPPAIVNLGASANPDTNLTTNINNYSGSSWTPPTTGLLIVDVHSAQTSGNPPIPIPQGNNLTFYQIATTLLGASGGQRLTRFGANLTDSITGVTGFLFTGSAQLCCRTSFYYVSGTTVDLSQGVTGSFVQSPTNSSTVGTTGSVALAAAGNSDNRVVLAVVHLANEGKAVKSGWTELDDFGGTAPATNITTEFRGDAFDTDAYLTWATSAAWGAIGSEIRAVSSAPQTYEDSVNVSRRESVLDRMTNNISPLILLAQKDGVSDGMNNSIPKNSSLNKVLTLSDSAGAGIFPALALLQILATTTAKSANMQGSVGLGGDFGIGGSSNNNINPNASLLAHMGVNLSGGLSLLSSLTIAERLGFSVLGQISIYPSLTLGRDLAFVPANISLIGGSVTLGQALGLIDVPRLDAQASLAFLQALGINLSSALSTTQVEAVLALAGHLGLGASAQLNSFPLVGLGERLFLLDANNANLFGTNVLNEVRGLNIAGGLSIQDNVAIPIDLNILTNKLISNLVNVSIQERLGISDSVFANMQASVSLGETAGMGNAVSQILNAGLSINVVGSVLTISGLTVIIVKGFVFTSDATRNPVSTQDSSKTTSSSDSGTSSVTTTMSPNYISTDDE